MWCHQQARRAPPSSTSRLATPRQGRPECSARSRAAGVTPSGKPPPFLFPAPPPPPSPCPYTSICYPGVQSPLILRPEEAKPHKGLSLVTQKHLGRWWVARSLLEAE